MNIYTTKGTCSREIRFEIEGDTIKHVEFVGGCSGNTQGVARLVEGMKVEDAISKIEGIKCGPKSTSCPDQLAWALKGYLANNQ
ncbi:MAG: TIGR03905 family TSCPD domain-containing protein [Butyrivibrio sp.]